MLSTRELHRFRFWGSATIAIVYLLILAGSVVRTTGAGMGCPDWPRCFGSWVPPTEASQLPPDYRTRYATQLHGVEEFNATKTWTEYINRLLGVATGFFIFVTVLVAMPFRKSDPKIFYLAVLAFVLVAFEGWLGKLVVDTNLRQGMVTLHMLVALVIVCVLIYAVAWPQLGAWQYYDHSLHRRLRILAFGGLLLVFVQVGLGTTVREQVDALLAQTRARPNITTELLAYSLFLVHRSFSILLVAAAALLLYFAMKMDTAHLLFRVALGIAVAMGMTVGAGMVLSYLALPLWAQPAHLVGGALLTGLYFFACLVVARGQPNALPKP